MTKDTDNYEDCFCTPSLTVLGCETHDPKPAKDGNYTVKDKDAPSSSI